MKKIVGVFCLLIAAFLIFVVVKPVSPASSTITLREGDSFAVFFRSLSFLDQISFKLYLKTHSVDLSKIQVGTYTFSGSLNKSAFLKTILAGPTQQYTRYTILEGRSSYDIDADLVKKGYIQAGEYLAFVSDRGTISTYAQGYEFLRQLPSGVASLEGFLYPDTYHIDAAQDFIKQLVDLQLQAFDSKVWGPYQQQLLAFDRGSYSAYDLLILASIVEKEEKSAVNKPVVAGIFFNRLSKSMQLDADITLCYGLKQPYEACPPAVIVQHLDDQNNLYNTRKRGGLTPQAISNPSAETVGAVLNYKNTDYMYYLHDMQGGIHYGKTLDQHNANKAQYLN